MPVQREEEHVCKKFDQEWIFTYGDMVTLLLVFFVLLLTFCKTDEEKFKFVSESLRPMPPGTPFFLEGQSDVLENLLNQIQTVEIPDEFYITVDDRGVVVSFHDNALFETGSASLRSSSIDSLERFSSFLFALPNQIVIEGHTDNQPIAPGGRYPSNWALSSARASSVADFLQTEGVEGDRMEVIGYSSFRPRYENNTPEKMALNRRVDVVIRPDAL